MNIKDELYREAIEDEQYKLSHPDYPYRELCENEYLQMKHDQEIQYLVDFYDDNQEVDEPNKW